MKTNLACSLRSAALAALLLAPVLAFANNSDPADRAARQFALQGSLPVQAAGPYVEIGTYRVQVWAKLGRPGAALSDGTWLYPNFTVCDGAAAGTLVVRFNSRGRVSELALVTPAVATAMSAPEKTGNRILIADRK